MRVLPRVTLVLVLLSLSGCVRRVVTMAADEAGHTALDAPPGEVDMHFVSDDPGLTWTVSADGDELCSTPCTRRLKTSESILMRTRSEGVYPPRIIDVAPQAKRAVLVAEASSNALFVNGVTFTSLGGMGIIIGITLSAVGCTDLQKHAGMCTAGLITGGVSAPLTAVAILMLVNSLPTVHVLPVLQADLGRGQPPLALTVTPAGIAGTF
jgi:hypothetical protein